MTCSEIIEGMVLRYIPEAAVNCGCECHVKRPCRHEALINGYMCGIGIYMSGIKEPNDRIVFVIKNFQDDSREYLSSFIFNLYYELFHG